MQTQPAPVQEHPAVPTVSAQAIAETKQQIGLLQEMARDILKRGIDYGRVPGTPQDSLWDPGASTITSAFNCFPGDRRILSLRDDSDKIAAVVEVPLISRATGKVMAAGVGAASTLEAKYKYRWVKAGEARQLGYDEEALKSLRTRIDKTTDEVEYRIPNPEHGELLNAILKMASKRAEVDAAESLPGVASVLRQLFGGQSAGGGPGSDRSAYSPSPLWSRFWGEVQRLGLTQNQAHQKLGVASMKDWLSQGRSLDDAVASLIQSLAEEAEADLLGTGSCRDSSS